MQLVTVFLLPKDNSERARKYILDLCVFAAEKKGFIVFVPTMPTPMLNFVPKSREAGV